MAGETLKIDIAIVGGGIMGLWSAYRLLKKNSNRTIVVFESEKFLGEHTTGRNSEVLHSGLYYPTNSLKHLHCLEGNSMWREFVVEKKLPILDCGKIIVAMKNQDIKLEELFQRGNENRIGEMNWLSKDEVDSYKHVLNIERGFFIRSSGVLNASEALNCLTQEIEALGGIILRSNKVSIKEYSPERFLLEAPDGLVESEVLVNTGGLFAITLRRQLDLHDYTDYFVKGSYLKLKKKMALDKLVYPIPPAHGLGLGVHLTLDTAGDQKFGPNTEVVANVEYSLNESLKDQMLPSVHQIFKGIDDKDLLLGYAGVRPKVKKEDKLITDFIFNTPKQHGKEGYFEFLGIESPGLTAAPSLTNLLIEAV